MKNSVKRLIAFILLICTFGSTLLLSSCIPRGWYMEYNDFPEGYTGGFSKEAGNPTEFYWVETYEECQAAIELLKSHSSTFQQTAIFTYEGEIFDTKYCFLFNRDQAKKIKYGDNPFDRYAENVAIISYAFYDNVSIDDLIFSYVHCYQAYKFSACAEFFELYETDPNIIESVFRYETAKDANFLHHDVYVAESKHIMFSISEFCIYEEKVTPMPDSGLESILNSIKVIE